MNENPTSNELEILMADAEELIQELNTDILNELEEEHRLQVENALQQIKRFQAELQANTEKKEESNAGYAPEGINMAIREIKKSMKELTQFLTK